MRKDIEERSPVRWLSDAAYGSAGLGERALAWADSQVGVRESGRNRGREVEGYQSAAGLGRGGGHAWCAAFVVWCLRRAGAGWGDLPGPGVGAAVRNWRAWGEARGRLRGSAGRGRLFYWLDRRGYGHIGFCLGGSVLGVFRTIEGNTDGESGSREGDGVYKRTRSVWELRRRGSGGSFGFIAVEAEDL